MPRFREEEIACLKLLGEAFNKGTTRWDGGNWAEIGLTEENHVSVLRFLNEIGAIEFREEEYVRATVPYSIFSIRAHAAELAREIADKEEESKEGKDIVEIVKLTLKKHPLTAWAFIIFLAITGAATAITQIAGALKALKIID